MFDGLHGKFDHLIQGCARTGVGALLDGCFHFLGGGGTSPVTLPLVIDDLLLVIGLGGGRGTMLVVRFSPSPCSIPVSTHPLYHTLETDICLSH